MPPWPSRLLSGSSSSNTTPTHGTSSGNRTQRDKPLPRVPPEYLDPLTLHLERNVSSPTTNRAPSTQQHGHNRSVSNPLPKMFSHKQSNTSLKYNNTDVPFDDELVPVLDDGRSQGPTKIIASKKSKVDGEDKTQRRCMCCDSKVKVPRELDKFRCLCCLTINDLKPVRDQIEWDWGNASHKSAEASTESVPPALPLPLSVDYTRAIIDRCVIGYLEARCKRQEACASNAQRAVGRGDVSTSGEESVVKRLDNPSGSYSPPNTPREPGEMQAASSCMRGISDSRHFAALQTHTPPPDYQIPTQGISDGQLDPVFQRQAGPIPIKPIRKPPPPPVGYNARRPSHNLLPSGSLMSNGPHSPRPLASPRLSGEELRQRRHADRIKSILRPLEDYIVESFGNFQCLNKSFSTSRPSIGGRARSESNIATVPPEPTCDYRQTPEDGLSELDAKTLLLGDIGENGSWWTGKLPDHKKSDKAARRKKVGEGSRKAVSSKSPNIDWAELERWYTLIHTAGADWRTKVGHIDFGDQMSLLEGEKDIKEITDDLNEAQDHALRTLLKITENLLKRPSRPMREPEDLRFLLILLSNPSLYPDGKAPSSGAEGAQSASATSFDKHSGTLKGSSFKQNSEKFTEREGSQHKGLLKRILGLLAHSSDSCHRYLVSWFARFDEAHLVKIIDLVASFVTYRIGRRSGRGPSRGGLDDGGLIPSLSGSAMSTSAQLHSAMGLGGSVKKSGDDPNAEPQWAADWQIKAASKVMSLLFTANNVWQEIPRAPVSLRLDPLPGGSGISPQAKARRTGQLLHTSSFYNTLLDYHDMIADFKIWETKRDKFAFCQYPLFLSMGTKIKILEYDARRQMENKAREAYFDQVIRQRAIDGNFHLRVRRECMVDDSLRQISEAVGSGEEELKKGLRVHFTGEEGVDAGGPRKEWFLMLVRDIFDPNHGMFVYDDESRACYFNANSFETSDQYYLVGVLLGLAIYNSTILDVALPAFAFRKLLAAAPSSITNTSNVSSLTGTKGQMTYTIADLAEFRPTLAAGLQQLLDFDGDVEMTYCRDFVAPVERYGIVHNVPLIPNGDNVSVTNANRHEFVDAYVRYLLDTAVARQFEPFKRGFFTVCAGNALSLFRAEEIELLIRGSDEPLDVESLRAVAVYENWKHFQPPHAPIARPEESVPVVTWFWELVAAAAPTQQRKLLTFVTGTDRIPAVGATSLVLKIVAGGDGWGGGGGEERERFPVARTCFNTLVLWRYEFREQLEEKLWRAVEESEGFGLK